MKYCMRCGVEVDEQKHRFCPLCNTIILTDAEIETLNTKQIKDTKTYKLKAPKPISKKVNQNIPPLIYLITLLVCITAIISLLVIDFVIGYNISWSLIPIISIILFILLCLPLVIKKKLYWFFTFDTFVLIFYFILLNILINNRITWSFFVILSILLLWIYVSAIFLNRIKGFILKLSIITIATTIFVLLITLSLKSNNVFSRLVLPINGLIFILVIISYMFIKTYFYKWHVIVSTITINTSILCIGIDLLINKFLVDRFILKWSHFVLIVLIPLTLCMFYIGNRYKINKYLMKKFHI